MNPRRPIVYSTPVITSLLSGHARLPCTSQIEVTLNGETTSDPYLVELEVESRSRRDISSEGFDQGKTACLYDPNSERRADPHHRG